MTRTTALTAGARAVQPNANSRMARATSGGDADEWRRLIRAYTVLHEPDKAKEALASARKALAGDAEAGQQLDALARELGIGG